MSDPVVLLSTGDVVGPAGGVTDNSMVLFSGTSGKLIKGNNAVVTAAGLAILDDVNAAAQRTTLGLGTAATANVTTSAIDTTAGRLTKVGDFGLGAVDTPVIANIDAFSTPSGFYKFTDGTGTKPVGGGAYAYVLINNWNGVTLTQTWIPYGASQMFVRTATTNNTWGAWREIALTDSPAFTGVPTAPTASVGTSTTQVATTAFVNAEIANDALSLSGGVVNGRTMLQKTGQVDWPTASVEIGATDGGQAILSFHRHGVEAGTLRLNGGFYFDNSVTSSGAVNATNLFGQGQTWQDVTGSRASGVAYTNSTGRPIQVTVNVNDSGGGAWNFVLNGTTLSWNDMGGSTDFASFVIPNGNTYQVNRGAHTIAKWMELR